LSKLSYPAKGDDGNQGLWNSLPFGCNC